MRLPKCGRNDGLGKQLSHGLFPLKAKYLFRRAVKIGDPPLFVHDYDRIERRAQGRDLHLAGFGDFPCTRREFEALQNGRQEGEKQKSYYEERHTAEPAEEIEDFAALFVGLAGRDLNRTQGKRAGCFRQSGQIRVDLGHRSEKLAVGAVNESDSVIKKLPQFRALLAKLPFHVDGLGVRTFT